jgi:tetratricopeptide (TPR) repeat protein
MRLHSNKIAKMVCSIFTLLMLPYAAAQPGTPFVPTSPELQPIEALRKQAKSFVEAKNLNRAQATLFDALNQMETTIEPDVQNKTKKNTPGYSLDRWHDCLREEAAIYKDLAGIYYKQSRMDEVQKAYQKRVTLRMSAGDQHEHMEPDYAYLVAVCDANGDYTQAERYYIYLLKARRLMWGKESDSHVLSTLVDFAKFERSTKDLEKAKMLEDRAKAIKVDAKPLPSLWFSY